MNARNRPGPPGGAPADPITVNDIITQVSDPMTIAPGHPLRGACCPYCGRAAGGAAVVLAAVFDMRHAACECGAVAEVAFLVHAQHDTSERGGLAAVALGQYAAHHRGETPR